MPRAPSGPCPCLLPRVTPGGAPHRHPAAYVQAAAPLDALYRRAPAGALGCSGGAFLSASAQCLLEFLAAGVYPLTHTWQHIDDILRRLGYEETAIATYHAEGVV
jgi:hypothetical protein